MQRSPRSFVEAFTLIELLIIVARLGLVAAVLLPVFAKSKCYGCGPNCANNLKQIGVAFRCWALDNGDKYPPQVSITNGGTLECVSSGVAYSHFQVMSNELSTPRILVCPQDAVRKGWAATTFATSASATADSVPFNSDTNVSYFVGVDAEDTLSSMFLAGDANIGLNQLRPASGLQSFAAHSSIDWYQPRHDDDHKGNIGFADGSVKLVDSRGLKKLLRQSGVAINRLAIPRSP